MDSSDILEVATIQNGRAVFGKLSIIGKQISECKLGNKGKEIELSKKDETDFSELPVIANKQSDDIINNDNKSKEIELSKKEESDSSDLQ